MFSYAPNIDALLNASDKEHSVSSAEMEHVVYFGDHPTEGNYLNTEVEALEFMIDKAHWRACRVFRVLCRMERLTLTRISPEIHGCTSKERAVP